MVDYWNENWTMDGITIENNFYTTFRKYFAAKILQLLMDETLKMFNQHYDEQNDPSNISINSSKQIRTKLYCIKKDVWIKEAKNNSLK